jgi:nucleoside-diphosphate-sugar epimerase
VSVALLIESQSLQHGQQKESLEMAKQKVLVLGGFGFVGTVLIRALASTSWAVPVAASRRSGVDATNRSQLQRAVQGADAVVNCIAGSPNAIALSAQLLADIAQDLPTPPRLIHLSSMAVYGPISGDIGESARLDGRLTPYAGAKVAAETHIAAYPRAIILRPGIIYGPGSTQWSGRIASWLRFRRIGHLGDEAEGYCNLVYVGDLVQVIALALQASAAAVEGRVFNLSLPNPPTWNEYFSRYAKVLGIPLVKISRTRLAIETKLLAPPLKIVELLASKVGLKTLLPPLPPTLPALLRQRIRLQTGAVEAALLPTSTPLEGGLARAAAWWRGDSSALYAASPVSPADEGSSKAA